MTYAYQLEYDRAQAFWSPEPGKLVAEVVANATGFERVLDAGCGEGKNAISVAHLANRVCAVDVSRTALLNFDHNHRFAGVTRRIDRIQADILSVDFPNQVFDLVIAYGLLHCFTSWHKALALVQSMKRWTRPGGEHILAILDDRVPNDPAAHPYLSDDGLIPLNELLKAYADSAIVHHEDEIITESHPTTRIPHQHSVVRLRIRIGY